MTAAPEPVVLDASVAVDLLAGTERAAAADRVRRTELHAPAHFDAEVLSALGRLYRADELIAADVDVALARLAAMPVTRHPVVELAVPAWAYRDGLRLVDALYVALADRLDVPLITTDHRLARVCPIAEAIPADTENSGRRGER